MLVAQRRFPFFALIWLLGCTLHPEVVTTGDHRSGVGDSGVRDGGDLGAPVPPAFQLEPDGGFPDRPPGAGQPWADASCAMQSVRAERLPLDLYFMLDSSYSMLEKTTAGPTKWDAVKSAMVAFLNDSQSAGIGVGLQYFPLVHPNVPDECQMDTQCGAHGPCNRLRTCAPGDRVRFCERDSDCMSGQTCVLLGGCSLTPDLCAPAGYFCGRGARGTPPGNQCLAIPGYCGGRDVCDVAPYAAPAVAIAPLPEAAPAVAMSLGAKKPDGLTPTAPALTGAIEHAQSRARQMPDRRTAVVLATDGLPVECAPVDIAQIAAIAQAAYRGTPSLSTFVVGVFSQAEAQIASMNLDTLARAGGTSKAFVINTGQNVTQAFLAALNQIRSAALACEYKIPPATMGRIDYGKVNVQFTTGGGQVTTIGNVPDQASCHATKGGWYYDVNPAAGATPGSIVACEATCNQLRSDSSGQIDIVLGCKTIIIE
jgi:hypothetical protein